MTSPIDGAISERVCFALNDVDLFGKCDDELELRLPSELKSALREYATARRMSMSAAAKLAIATMVHGADHVASVAVQRVLMAPIGVPQQGGAVAPTAARATEA